MYLHIEPALFERFPRMRVVVVIAQGINNQQDRPELAIRWHAIWIHAAIQARGYGTAQLHPHVRAFREQFRAMGVSNKKFPSATEALLRRVLKEEKPFHINALVDFYHTVSLQYVVPVGGFDLGALHAPLEARLTRDGDLFQALDDELPQSLPPGEVAYASGQTILTRHLMWRQARTGLLTHATHSAVLVAEVPGDIGEEIAVAVQTALRTGLQTYFEVPTTTFILDEHHSTAAW
ncbi:MAG: phenylalanine--tRNA ligase beta subunit-related protein [Chloroflexota bacterium]|nr:phenylalanine--tRNA ligase beta subunit-related protein [Chloroflexota bacterium]